MMLMLQNVAYWINIPLDESDTSIKTADGDSSSEKYDGDDQENKIIAVWETAVQPLTDLQRLIFFSLTIPVVVIALVGNVLVLYVNVSRLIFTCSELGSSIHELGKICVFFLSGSSDFSSELV